MSNVIPFSTRTPAFVSRRPAVRDERGAQTAEYGVTVLVAVALALCVFGLVTRGAFNGVISGLLEAVLNYATSLIGK